MPHLAVGNGSALVSGILFIALCVAELLWPARRTSHADGSRWFGNIALFALSTGAFLLPMIAALLAAVTAHATRFGLLFWVAPPAVPRFIVAVLAMDVTNYAIHRLSHSTGVLWRLHAVHHSDPALDVTTALRHHPVEALYAAILMSVAVTAFGITPDEVLGYILLERFVQFPAHANLNLPRWLEAVLRKVFVTPRYHALHHSKDRAHSDTNYGQVLVLWDMLFRTTCAAPQHSIAFGLDDFRDNKSQSPHWLLAQPIMPRGSSDQLGSDTTRNRSVSPVS